MKRAELDIPITELSHVWDADDRRVRHENFLPIKGQTEMRCVRCNMFWYNMYRCAKCGLIFCGDSECTHNRQRHAQICHSIFLSRAQPEPMVEDVDASKFPDLLKARPRPPCIWKDMGCGCDQCDEDGEAGTRISEENERMRFGRRMGLRFCDTLGASKRSSHAFVPTDSPYFDLRCS